MFRLSLCLLANPTTTVGLACKLDFLSQLHHLSHDVLPTLNHSLHHSACGVPVQTISCSSLSPKLIHDYSPSTTRLYAVKDPLGWRQ